MLKNILKVVVVGGLAAIGVCALIKSELMPKLKEKLRNYDADFEKKMSEKASSNSGPDNGEKDKGDSMSNFSAKSH